jgi:hypothetical protein
LKNQGKYFALKKEKYYVLIGTLASFAIAVLIGIAASHII